MPKYDTNQLDPDFPKRVAEAQQTATLPNLEAKTRNFATVEESTKKFDNNQFQSLFDSPNYQAPAVYQTTKLVELEKPTSRKVEKVGLPENLLLLLSYCPFQVGLIASLLQLLFVPKSEAKVRFHAAQGLASHLVILAITAIMGFGGNFFDLADTGNAIFQFVALIILIISMVKVWQGKPVHFEAIEELTDWLNEKVIINNSKQ